MVPLLSIYRAKFLCFIAVLAIYHSKCWNVPSMPVLLSLSYKNKEISVFIKIFDTYSVFFFFSFLGPTIALEQSVNFRTVDAHFAQVVRSVAQRVDHQFLLSILLTLPYIGTL